MRRGIALAKTVFHRASRAAERVLPPVALWFLLWPLTALLGALQARRNPHPVPATNLPLGPNANRPGTWQRWRYFSRAQTHFWLIGWIDRLSDAKWQRRIAVNGLEKLTTLAADRPVIVCSLHTTSIPLLGAWLRALGIPAAHVPMDLTWFSDPTRVRKVALAKEMGAPFTVRPDQPRDMIEFLKPGHVLVLTSDFTGGRLITIPMRNATVKVATGLFRLAQSTGAAICPMLIFDAGRWRYEVTVFDPVPQSAIDAGDNYAAARYLVDCLFPMAMARPEQAMDVLVAAIN